MKVKITKPDTPVFEGEAKLIQLLREHFKDDATMLFLLAVI